MARLQESKGRFFVTVPKEYVTLKNWSKGQVLLMVLNSRHNVELVEGVEKIG